MSYVLEPLEPLSEGVYRILREQSAEATRALARRDREVGVHEARKATKRCRALLQAVRPGFVPSAWEVQRDRYRDAARVIGGARDADVRLRTFDTLARGEHPEIRAELELGRVHVDASALEQARARFAEVPEVPLDMPTEALFDGMTRTYTKMRRASRHDGGAEAVHTFRRRIKEHLYQLQLVKPAWLAVFNAMIKDADRAADELGQWHDLVMLRAWMSERGLLTEVFDARILASMDDHLHRSAAWVPKLTAMPPRAFRVWIDRLWR